MDGIDYVLYLRWRWCDPWAGYIIKYAKLESIHDTGEWSSNLLLDFEFTEDDVESAKEELIRIFENGVVK